MAKASRNPIDEKAKAAVVKTLMPIIYNSLELRNQVKLAHWNLVDPNFISIHRLLDELTETLDEGIDGIAERVRQLGGFLDSSTETIAKQSSLAAFPSGKVSAHTVADEVSQKLALAVKDLHEAIDSSDEAGDAITADLLTNVSGKLEVHIWFFESSLG